MHPATSVERPDNGIRGTYRLCRFGQHDQPARSLVGIGGKALRTSWAKNSGNQRP